MFLWRSISSEPKTTLAKVGVCTLMGDNHVVLGATGGLVTGAYLQAPMPIHTVMIFVGGIGGLVPDGDTESSKLGQLLPKVWHKLTPGHRHITHSLLYCVLMYGLAYGGQILGEYIGWWISPPLPYIPAAFGVGVLTHILADGMTDRGVPLFAPFTKRRFRLLGPFSLTTNTPMESKAVTLLTALGLAYVVTVAYRDIRLNVFIVYAIAALVCVVVITLYKRSLPANVNKRRREKEKKRLVNRPERK